MCPECGADPAAHRGFLESPLALEAGVLVLMAFPSSMFSIAAIGSTDLNPLPDLVHFGMLEWWLFIGPALFGIVWPAAIARRALRKMWLPHCGAARLACLALLTIVFNAAAFTIACGAANLLR